jgi:thymidylate synthase
MIDEPSTIVADSFQQVWTKVVKTLAENDWERRNLMVQVKNPCAFDEGLHQNLEAFCRQVGILGPRHVAYTIFPQEFFSRNQRAEHLFNGYNRRNGLYERLQRRYARHGSWGTYFRRMTYYDGGGTPVNQLENVIRAINTRENVSKAALTIVIQKPGGETTRPLGGPCLNYLAIQAERNADTTLGLLAVYRNHDFLQKAYGNYWGLCNLLRFLARETGMVAGPVTCISSHAYVDKHKPALRAFVENL